MLRLTAAICFTFAMTIASAAGAQTPAPSAPAGPVPATADDVTALLGDWTISGESQMGPFSMSLSMDVADGRPVATMSSEIQAPTEITDISKDGESLVLSYHFDYDGMSIPSVLTITPKADKFDAYFYIADGAFEMGGVGEKAAATAE